jgi:hypothetical protein
MSKKDNIIKIKHKCFMDIITNNEYFFNYVVKCLLYLRELYEWYAEDTENFNMSINNKEQMLDFVSKKFLRDIRFRDFSLNFYLNTP